ncbi:MAG: glycosyltransferase family 2 protein [Lachnospiraceae bacterium]|nr:glycosyltransferase family 2 protein [Lachnospiraceae bacterium]
MEAKVSVVIPNFNGLDYLDDCIDSLMKQNVRKFEIIIVDDASADESMQKIMEKYPAEGAWPEMRFIRHFKNMGFCASVNDGIAAAKAEYVILLNNDTVADPDFVRALWNAIRKDEQIFSVSSRMISLKDKEILDDCGDLYCALGWAFAPAKDKSIKKYKKRAEVFAACGGASIYRKSMLDELGGFDEAHFAYLEDMDMGYRAKLKGWRNMYEPSALVWHAGSASSGSRHNKFKVKLSARNNVYLISKNMPWWQILINLPFLLAGGLVKQAYFIRKKLGCAYFTGTLEGVKLSLSEGGRERRKLLKEVPAGRFWKTELELIRNVLRRFAG